MEYFWSDLSLTNNTPTVFGINAIAQSVHNALHIESFDIMFDPMGCNIDPLLFEPMDEITTLAIKEAVLSCVERKEPRVTVSHSRTTVVANYDTLNYELHLVLQILNDEKYYSLDFIFPKL